MTEAAKEKDVEAAMDNEETSTLQAGKTSPSFGKTMTKRAPSMARMHFQTKKAKSEHWRPFWKSSTPDILVADENSWDVMQYDITMLTSWRSLLVVSGTFWENPGVVEMMVKSPILSICVAFLMYTLPYVRDLDPYKLNKLSTFLNVFVGLMLGFFLTSSMSRWFDCANGLLEFYDSIRMLQMQCFALGVNEKRTTQLTRYGILSAWLLHFELRFCKFEYEDYQKANDLMWSSLTKERPDLTLGREAELLREEADNSPATLIWTWAASLVGRMAQDGDIPPMPSPTYGRMIELVQKAYDSIREVRTCVLVQTPFIYVHTLAFLVHLNNFLNAIIFGAFLGVATQNFLGRDVDKRSDKMRAMGMQTIITSFFISLVAPFIYQALLQIGIAFIEPFLHDELAIPTHKLVERLENDTEQAKMFARNPPSWPVPSYKQSVAKSVAKK